MVSAVYEEKEFLPLLGERPETVEFYCTNRGIPYEIVYTHGLKPGSALEKRVIRLKKSNDKLEILVGFFQVPLCVAGDIS